MVKRRTVLGGASVFTLGSIAGCLGSDDGDDGAESNNSDMGLSEEDQTREDISLQYSLGLSSLEGGTAGIDNGTIDFNLEMYEMAVESFESAEEAFERAEGQFSEAIDLTYELGNAEAREICERGEAQAVTLGNAAAQYQRAAESADEGRSADVVNSRIEQAEDFETEAERSPPRDQSVLDSVLDLEG